MVWRAASEQAALGFLGYGALSFVFSSNPIAILVSGIVGSLVGLGYAWYQTYPVKRFFQSKTSACVSVTRDLYFREVSTKAPERTAFVRVQNLDKKELFKRLSGKRLNAATIPFHMRLAIEERRSLDLPWEAIEPHLRVL